MILSRERESARESLTLSEGSFAPRNYQGPLHNSERLYSRFAEGLFCYAPAKEVRHD